MDSTIFDLSPEATEQLQAAVSKAVEAIEELWENLVKIVREFMDRVREILGRFFLKRQLLEWRVPYRIANFISNKLYWYWAWQLGLRWFRNKMLAFE